MLLFIDGGSLKSFELGANPSYEYIRSAVNEYDTTAVTAKEPHYECII